MIKKIILRFFTYVGILFLVDSFVTGFEFKIWYTVAIFALLLSITNIALTPVIKFLTFPTNNMSFAVFNFALSCLYIYVFNMLFPGFIITSGHIGPFDTGSIVIPTIKLTNIGVIIVSSAFISLLNSIVSYTQKSAKVKSKDKDDE